MSTDQSTGRLNLVQEAIRGGNVTLVLGPNTARGTFNLAGDLIPSLDAMVQVLCSEERISPDEQRSLSHDDVVDYCTRNENARQKLDDRLKQAFGARRPAPSVHVLTTLVWHKIYTFDISDALEVAYRRNHGRSQAPRVVRLSDPVSIDVDIAAGVEIIKLFGDVSDLSQGCYLNTPRYQDLWSRSSWLDVLADDIKTRPILFCGEDGDGTFLLNKYRQLRRGQRGGNLVVFITPDLTALQSQILGEEEVLQLDSSFQQFADAIHRIFPHGRNLTEIASDTSEIKTKGNHDLAVSLLNDFHVLTRDTIASLARQPREPRGGIRRFYRGDDVTWRDVADGVAADLTPYRNLRNRIEFSLQQGTRRKHLFLMTSPAGMGKTVGLLSTALWLRNLVNVPVLWFRSDGSLSRFLRAIRQSDFMDGAYVFVDDIANYADEFDDVSEDVLSRLCFIGTARETRWLRYGPRIEERLTVSIDQIRLLNRGDAEQLHDRLKRYGTLVHFRSPHPRGQVDEILERSRRDLLVLVKELGLGERFEKTLQSEVDELTDVQRFAYFVVCIPDRIQISMPVDLFNRTMRLAYPGMDPVDVLRNMGRLIRKSAGARSLVSRHSIIAARIVETRRLATSATMRRAVEGLLEAFSHYRVPIIMHHANTGHARVFKAVLNNNFLSFTFGFEGAIEIYRQYEKPFEKDGFFWQQFGLTYLKAGEHHKLALETLRHAAHIHDHVQIRHSLAVAKLVTCYDLGMDGLGEEEFEKLRTEGVSELEQLHIETHMREDMAMTTLVHHDLKISERYDPQAERERRLREYHTRLAFYLRDHPHMAEARKEYEALHEALMEGKTVKWEEAGELMDDEY